jgi:hypothetical protein
MYWRKATDFSLPMVTQVGGKNWPRNGSFLKGNFFPLYRAVCDE